MSFFEDLKGLLTFDGHQLAATKLSIASSKRRSTHSFRFQRGGRRESHGRSLYEFKLSCAMHSGDDYSPPLFPDVVTSLRKLYDDDAVGSLVLPHIGAVRCAIDAWGEDVDFNVPSGVGLELTFAEVEGFSGLGGLTLGRPARVTVDKATTDLRYWHEQRPKKIGLMDSILRAADSILAIRDQFDLQQDRLAANLASLTGLIREADRAFELNDADDWPAIVAMSELFAAAVDLATTPGTDGGQVDVYIVPRQMNVIELSAAIYDGDTSRAGDILALNDFRDPMAIWAATQVRYVEA